ncbi:hypothetical protein QCA50_006626 [Cerrena zonata]|uniref:Prolyl 4-hydroxylase alpha subunit Fe(2+) 2OG dioxygenase domain-containing protein n=1 Tax=Cerrena zonata TaxID=2478898 RepID=A0AAW0G9C3_9APHY
MAHGVPTMEQLESLKSALVNKPPYCSGTLRLPAEEYVLYFGKDKISHRLNFTDVDDDTLNKLAETCDMATFGVNQQDVLDESYRKAGKLDSEFFAPKFNFDGSGLRDIIRNDLLEGTKAERNIRAELYKLNVYGPGSFFKPHKDTPRSETMFGSLVLIYPTIHEGGALTLRDCDKEWSFDSAQAVRDTSDPEIGYVIFYSDVEHEVTEVISGYRVTITYNLYFEPSTAAINHTSLSIHGNQFSEVLQSLLSNPNFLSKGGHLGFGLHRQYALKKDSRSLDYIYDNLKGSDATLLDISRALGLSAKFYLLYGNDEYDEEAGEPIVVCPQLVDLNDADVEGTIAYHLREYYGGEVIERAPDHDSNSDFQDDPVFGRDSNAVDMEVYWVTELTKLTEVKNTFLAYGNQATIAYVYGYGCLVVSVGPYGDRKNTIQPVHREKKRST